MEPVVNGLEDDFANEIEVMRLDVNQGLGLDAFRFYRLRGHPAYVLLNPQGEVLWSGLGVQSIEMIETQIQAALIAREGE